jgi:hypothetical protein
VYENNNKMSSDALNRHMTHRSAIPTIGHSRSDVSSEGQEKYLRELSITPVGYFTGAIKNHSRAVSHRNYFARYFRGTGMVFQRLALL